MVENVSKVRQARYKVEQKVWDQKIKDNQVSLQYQVSKFGKQPDRLDDQTGYRLVQFIKQQPDVVWFHIRIQAE